MGQKGQQPPLLLSHLASNNPIVFFVFLFQQFISFESPVEIYIILIFTPNKLFRYSIWSPIQIASLIEQTNMIYA